MSMREKLGALGREAALGKIKEAGLREYGIRNEELYGKIARTVEGHLPADGPLLAAGGLNNCDYSGMLLRTVREEPGKVLRGLEALGWLTGAERLTLYLPEEETGLAAEVSAKAAELGVDVEVVNGIVDTRRLRGGIVCHTETLAALSDVIDGTYEGKTLVSVVKYAVSGAREEVKAPAYVPFGTKLSDILAGVAAGAEGHAAPGDAPGLTGDKAAGPVQGAAASGAEAWMAGTKAVGVGARLYTPKEAEGLTLTEELALGDGVVKLYGDGCCMVDASERALLEARKKSCGKCTFCREGLLQLYIRTREATTGKGSMANLQTMKEIGEAMETSCCCTLGDFGGSLALETMRQFGNEYEDHIQRKKCTAGTCLAFVNIYIDPQKCTGCGACLPSCEGGYIEGLPGYIHMVETLDCVKCGKCMEACPEGAVVRTLGMVPRLPDRLTRVGRFKRY